MSNVAFLGEGVMEVATEEGEGIESKDEIGKERTKLRNAFVFGFLQGTAEELPLPVSACSNHCRKRAFLAGWSVSVVPASTRQCISFSVDLHTGESTGQHGFALKAP